MSLFNRIFKIGQAEAHSALDKLENPIKLSEQGIRDMKTSLDKSLQALAEVKALAIRAKTDAETNKSKAADYEQKAMQLIEQAGQGKMDAAEADRLATLALQRKEECEKIVTQSVSDKQKFDASIAQLQVNIDKLKSQISKWENELKVLKARAKVSEATINVNKQMSQIDSSGTVAMLEKMKSKVDKDEALAEAYGEIANESKSVDDEIDKALETTTIKSSESLAALKAKMAALKQVENV